MQRIASVLTNFLLLSLVACDGLYQSGSKGRLHSHPPTEVKSQALSTKALYHKVKVGDTLYSIAHQAGLDYKNLAKWNQIAPPFIIFSGQRIILKNNHNIENKEVIKITKPKLTANNKTKKKKLKIIWQWPLKGRIEKTFTLPDQKGVDIVAYKRHSILAAASGKVVYSGSGNIGYGNLVIIKHDKHFLSVYGNNSRLLVKEGSIVKRGQSIAEISPVDDRKAILHFEIRRDGKPMNPQYFLPAP